MVYSESCPIPCPNRRPLNSSRQFERSKTVSNVRTRSRVHPDTCATCGEVLTLENISRRDPGHCTRCAIVQPEDPTPCAGPSKGCMHPGCGEEPSHRRPGTWVDGNGTPMTGTYCTIHATQLERAGVRMIRGIDPTPGRARTAWNRLDNGEDDL
jgi:hypothetical protein